MILPPDTPPISSPVFEVAADKETILRLAVGCVSQNVTSGSMDIPTIRSSDAAAGVIIATNYLPKVGGGLLGRDIRTTMRLEARDGRFRIFNSNVGLFSEFKLEWSPLPQGDSRWPRLEERLSEQASAISSCVSAAADTDSW